MKKDRMIVFNPDSNSGKGEKPPPVKKPEAEKFRVGGDGGGSNSPSRRSYPVYTTSLVSSFILPG